ncbi:PEGA domain-containing protein [Candidatus Woesebacteria bacterium]|nr:PEGA domain-containing protein [Candidatus Woesebacteria bacterium]
MKWLFTLCLFVVSAVLFSGCNPLDYRANSGLQVITGQTPSSVFINGQFINKTPLIEKNLKPGPYHILIQPENSEFVPYETDLILRNGLLTVITWKPEHRPELSSGVILELEPLEDASATKISFVTIPDGAIITIDGRKEFSPTSIQGMSPGVHEFEVTLPSYETQKHTIDLQAGYELKATVKLAKLLETNSQTATPAAQPTPEPVSAAGSRASTPTPAATASATPKSTPLLKPTPSATPIPTTVLGAAITTGSVKIISTGFKQDGVEVLRVRSTPSNAGAELGFAQVGQSYPYANETKNGWYKIAFKGGYGWVVGTYAKIEE